MAQKKNPFGIGQKNPLPDYDGPDIPTDEVERAMMEDLASRGDEIEQESRDAEQRAERMKNGPTLLNGTVLFGLFVSAVGFALTWASWQAAGPGEAYNIYQGAMITGAFIAGAGLIRGQ